MAPPLLFPENLGLRATQEDFLRGPVGGSMDWLWFRPLPSGEYNLRSESLYAAYNFTCRSCDTYGVVEPDVSELRCWCCEQPVNKPLADDAIIRKYGPNIH